MTARSQEQSLDPEAAQAPITTRRLFLRAPDIADIPALTRLLADRRISANTLAIPYPYPAIEGWRFVRHQQAARANRGGANFLVTARGNPQRIVGAVGFRWRAGCDPEIGYWIAVRERRRGFASEAARALLARLFLEGGAARLQAWVRPENRASFGVLRRLGFRRIGKGMRFSRSWRRTIPYIQLALTRAEWARWARPGQSAGGAGESGMLL